MLGWQPKLPKPGCRQRPAELFHDLTPRVHGALAPRRPSTRISSHGYLSGQLAPASRRRAVLDCRWGECTPADHEGVAPRGNGVPVHLWADGHTIRARIKTPVVTHHRLRRRPFGSGNPAMPRQVPRRFRLRSSAAGLSHSRNPFIRPEQISPSLWRAHAPPPHLGLAVGQR